MEKQNIFDKQWLFSISDTDETRDKISEIISFNRIDWYKKYLSSEKELKLNLQGDTIFLRESEAWFSLRIYSSLFKDKEHLKYSGFDGSDAKVVIDLGANIGLYTMAIKKNNQYCKVISLEPNPIAFELLTKNIQENNFENVVLINKAIADTDTPMYMKILRENTISSSKYLGDLKKEKRTFIDPNRIENILVQSITLQTLFDTLHISEVDIVKIDIEGMELEILEHSVNLLHKVKKIVIEWHSIESKEKIIDLLTKNSFELVYQDGEMYGDLYFVNISQNA